MTTEKLVEVENRLRKAAQRHMSWGGRLVTGAFGLQLNKHGFIFANQCCCIIACILDGVHLDFHENFDRPTEPAARVLGIQSKDVQEIWRGWDHSARSAPAEGVTPFRDLGLRLGREFKPIAQKRGVTQ